MPEQPTAENTTIETATVQIHTLTVGGKQMTQNIFRQLINRPVVNTAGRINGTPWGTVNYHPERCEDASEHLHVVWQAGDQLRRAVVPAPERAYMKHPLASEYVMARIAEGATRTDDTNIRLFRDPNSGGAIVAHVNLYGVSFVGTASAPFLSAWDRTYSTEEALERLEHAYTESFGGRLRPSAEVAQLLPADAYKASWRELSALPQLFIGR